MENEATSLVEYFIALQSVTFNAGLLQGIAIGVAITFPPAFIFGLLSYKTVHRIMGGHVLTKAR